MCSSDLEAVEGQNIVCSITCVAGYGEISGTAAGLKVEGRKARGIIAGVSGLIRGRYLGGCCYQLYFTGSAGQVGFPHGPGPGGVEVTD